MNYVNLNIILNKNGLNYSMEQRKFNFSILEAIQLRRLKNRMKWSTFFSNL